MVWGCPVFHGLRLNRFKEKGQLVILDTPFWELTCPLFMLVHRQKYQGPGFKGILQFCEDQV